MKLQEDQQSQALRRNSTRHKRIRSRAQCSQSTYATAPVERQRPPDAIARVIGNWKRLMRKLITSGSPFESQIGFSRAVRTGDRLAISGTAPIAPDGTVTAPGDVLGQTRRCLEIIAAAIADAGLRVEDVVRTRIMLTDITTWRDAAQAHGEVFAQIRPACTFVQVAAFIDPGWLVEVEADCIAAAPARNTDSGA